MLPARHRLTRPDDFRAAVRGPRAGGGLVVVHASRHRERADLPARVGFVVSRAVGGAVTRNAVKRRLRHCAAQRLDLLPAGVDVVVRASPATAQASYAQLDAEYERLVRKVIARLAVRPVRARGTRC